MLFCEGLILSFFRLLTSRNSVPVRFARAFIFEDFMPPTVNANARASSGAHLIVNDTQL
jgi:hypothetical protein